MLQLLISILHIGSKSKTDHLTLVVYAYKPVDRVETVHVALVLVEAK